ncbi:MAG: L-2-hydroxyglutarate oxidase [Calditrichae bacterium]|nr:L-2-hydroxyglutarate oxidase [Calditrichota bacterium]MCB9057517.1 L-2-hydroxyglutarate oxidase [Calditrichia bacterium]
MNSKVYDIIIIGAGIVGLATAMKLARNNSLNLKILVIETENEIASHQTGNNSGVIHSGLYYAPGSLKAQNCVAGRNELYMFCENNLIKHERCGKLVVATDKAEIKMLNRLHKRGIENQLKGLKRLSAEEMREYEPHVNGVAALLVPETGIVDYMDVSKAYQWHINRNDGEISLDTKFLGLKHQNPLVVKTSQGEFETRNIINCAGLYSDRVAKKCGINPGLKIVPFRGEYYELIPEKEYLVKNLIYPVPDPKFPFLGVHFTRMIHGGIEAGPNAVLAFKREGYKKSDISFKDSLETFMYPGFWMLALRYGYISLGEFYRSYSKKAFVSALQKLIPEVTENDVQAAGSGVRAQALGMNGKLLDDFRIIERPNMIHVLNAPSPAATASLSIGGTIADMAVKNFDLA